MAAISNLFVELGLTDKGFSSGLAKAEGSTRAFSKAIAGIALGIVGAAAAGAVVAFKIGSAWDSATDTIITKTGASGQALTDLQNITKDVFTSIPTDLDKASQAVAELSQKSDATGKTLTELAKTELELSRITGTDLAGNIESSTKIFNLWGVAAEDQTKTLDDLFNVSQKTGVGIDQLMQEVRQFAPVLKAMGLSVAAGANLIGKMDKAGLNTARDMKGLNAGIIAIGKTTTDIKGGLTDVYNGIKNAGSASEATAMAVKIFGKAAGPELAQAIREGKISLDDLIGSADVAGDSILATAAKTNDFAENFKIFKNNLEAALIPLGTFVFNGLNKLIPLLTEGTKAIGDFAAGIKKAFDTGGFGGVVDFALAAIRDLIGGIADLGKQALNITIDTAVNIAGWLWDHKGDIWGGIKDAVGWTVDTFTQAITTTIDGALALGGDLLKWAGNLWGWIKSKLFGGASDSATSGEVSVGDQVIDIGSIAINAALSWAASVDWAGLVTAAGTAIVDAFTTATKFAEPIATEIWDKIKSVDWASVITVDSFGAGSSFGTSVHNAIISGVKAAFTAIKDADISRDDVENVVTVAGAAIAGAFVAAPAAIAALSVAAASFVAGALKGLVFGDADVSDIGSNIIDQIQKALFGTLTPAAGGSLAGSTWSGGLEGWLNTSVQPAIDKLVEKISGAIKAIPGKVADAVGKLKVDIPAPTLPTWMTDGWTDLKDAFNKIVAIFTGGQGGSSSASIITNGIKKFGEAVNTIAEIAEPQLPGWLADGWKTLSDAIDKIKKLWSDLQFWKNKIDNESAPSATGGFMGLGGIPSDVLNNPYLGEGYQVPHNPLPDQQKFSSDASTMTSVLSDLGGRIADFAKTTDTTRNSVANAFVGMRTDVVTITTDLVNQSTNQFVGLRNSVVTIASDLSNATVNQFVGLRNNAVNLATGLTNEVTNAFVGMRNSAVSLTADLANAVINSFVGMRSGVVSIVNDTASSVLSTLNGLAGSASSAGYSIGDALGSGIYSGMAAWAGAIASTAAALVSSAVAAARAAADAHSPSRKMMALGDDMVTGLVLSLNAGQRPVGSAMNNLVTYPGAWSATTGGSGSGGVSHSWGGITINVTGNGDPRATADEVFAVFAREMQLRSAS